MPNTPIGADHEVKVKLIAAGDEPPDGSLVVRPLPGDDRGISFEELGNALIRAQNLGLDTVYVEFSFIA